MKKLPIKDVWSVEPLEMHQILHPVFQNSGYNVIFNKSRSGVITA